MPRISVLIGIYNCAFTLVEALDSLYAQTYQDFKIILCEDGSTDDTYAVAKEYAEKHDNIVLIRNEKNMGLNYTLNRCIEHADTEYCARMDGDDISLPTRFEKEIKFLDEHPEFAVVSCPMVYFDESGDYRVGKAKPYPDKNDFVKGTPICHAPCMIRTDVLKAVGGYTDDLRLRRVEDYHLWLKIYLSGYSFYNLSEPLYKMRDDRNAYKRRNWTNRRNEMYVRFLAYSQLGIPLYKWVYLLRPLILFVLPTFVYDFLHRKLH